MEELKAFKNEQTKKMGWLEHKLVLNIIYIYIYPSLDLFAIHAFAHHCKELIQGIFIRPPLNYFIKL